MHLPVPTINCEDLFVIGDVHGCAQELETLLEELPLRAASAIVFLGDYIDRGPNSRQVIELIMDLSLVHDVFPLMGNHESLLLDFIDSASPLSRARFMYNGGGATLQSYLEEPGRFSIPSDHIHFLRTLNIALQDESHFFVHAGVPDMALDEIQEKDRSTLLWVRDSFHASLFRWNKTIVHGHSRVPEVQRTERRINLDTGCVYGGKLTGWHVNTDQLYQVPRSAPVTHHFLQEPANSRRKAVRFNGRVDVRMSAPMGLPPFHTVNYNDFGVLLACDSESEPLLALNQRVGGTLLPGDEHGDIDFEGTIVRIDNDGSIRQYAVRFDSPAESKDR